MQPTIAIVDDNPADGEMLHTLLGLKSYSVQLFRSGAELLAAFRKNSFNLIIMDLAMPDIDGYELCRKVREISPDIPIVAMSALAYPADQERALGFGFSHFASKPILDIDHFLQKISHLLHGASQSG